MKTTTVREVQHNLKKILQWIEDGEVVTVTRHKRVVANIIPSTPAARKTEWPDFTQRLTDIWGKGAHGQPASKIIVDERDERP